MALPAIGLFVSSFKLFSFSLAAILPLPLEYQKKLVKVNGI